ncbi:MAG TPA: transglycosylase SLT domain-containing protein [Polyangiaceae bacterium]|jgi:soluble lytic murein transglycosylase|nr:transglycosylase SLT domain-containing protein [Polyangiaceae bacterium]
MDRETPSAPRLKSRRWSAALLVPCAALLVYCESRQAPEQAAPKAPPFRIATSASASPPRPSASFSLTDFRPLLTAPELASVATLLENGAPEAAARELDAWLAKSPPALEQRFRYDFLLARLHEQGGQLAAALIAYGRVGGADSPLTNYARAGEARMLLALGRPKDALARLATLPDDAPVSRLKWPVLAEAARKVGDRATAIGAYSRSLAATPPGADKADGELAFANLLLSGPASAEHEAEALQALDLARRIQDEMSASRQTLAAAKADEERALAALAEPARNAHRTRDAAGMLDHVHALLDAREFDQAEQAAGEALAALSEAERKATTGCELQFSLGKARASRRNYARAGDAFEALLADCSDQDLRARAEFMAGKAAASAGDHMLAVKRFAALEQEAPKNSLADDARLYGALSYLELGVEARFTELLSSLPDDYPDGDMVVEGTFRLALRRLDKQDWAGAARVLERVLDNKYSTGARAADFAGRERYFHARALAATGETERPLAEYEALIKDLPLSYYMLCAYSALAQVDHARAEAALNSALTAVASGPIVVTNRAEFSGLGFTRALELFGVGDLDDGARELDALGLGETARPELLWGLSKLYADAGSVKLSHAAARRALSASPSSWPADAWLDAWKLAYPAPYHEIVEREAKRTALNPALIYAIMREESAFDPDAESPADAYGLMQLIVPTAKTMARPLGLPFDRNSLKRPNVNVALGASVLAKYASAFPEDPLLAIPAYNAGPLNPKKWLHERPNADFDIWVELIPYVETRRYMKRVLSSRAAYAFLYQREAFAEFATLPAKIQ